jgi:transcriptional regulator with PAS, ATPase and Fis domain
MSVLLSIKAELQHIVEAMHAVTNVDIIVVDKQLDRVVSTVKKEYEFGKKAPMNSAFHKCILTGEQFFLENPRYDFICIECENVKSCKELIEFCIPIKYSNEIIGVLGMCAYDEKAKENLLANRDSYMNFESQLSDIISTIISEKNNTKMLEYSSLKLMTIINSLNDGIIIVNNNKDIITTNNYINDKLNLNINKMPQLWELLTNDIYNKLINNNFNGEAGPVRLNGEEFMINASPIMINEIQDGIVLLLSDLNKMRESVLKSNRKKDLITFEDIVGESELLLQARREAIQVAEKDASVLIMGETGTGKEVFARAIHNASKRRNDTFMAINCGAITESLIESELFGYEKGSFTGASNSGKPGKFETCKDGTLFLDEIGDLPFMMQVKLNRALAEKEITRIGGNTPIKVNPRIISATHKNLYSMVGKNLFRDDLYYRLNVIPIFLPPLRERGYDIIVLSRYFLNRFTAVYNKDLKGFTSDSERLLMGYNFPGNIRELRNLVEYAVIFEENSFVGVENLRKKMGTYNELENFKLADLTKAYEKTVISDKIQKMGDSFESKKEIANQLGISIATLYRKLEC